MSAESKIVYVVEMLRYGDREAHSYIAGVYSDRKIAEYEAQIHMLMRAGKYDAEIREEVVDGFTSKGLVCYIDEVECTEKQLTMLIKKRKQLLKKREEFKNGLKASNQK